jgi:HD-like signal output (HDOD) protein
MAHQLATERARTLLTDVSIPPCPRVLVEVLNEIKKTDVGFERFDEIIGRDVALATGTLKVVNSPFFGLRQPIGSIPHAVRLLGVNNVVNVVMGLVFQSSFRHFEGRYMDPFWARSNRRARVAMMMAQACGSVAVDEAYTVGLLCDCGVPLMHSRFQEYSERFEKGRTLQDRSLTTYESSRFGTTHTAAGKVMASSWKLPEAFRTCILRHHDSADYYTEDQLGDATGLLAVHESKDRDDDRRGGADRPHRRRDTARHRVHLRPLGLERVGHRDDG